MARARVTPASSAGRAASQSARPAAAGPVTRVLFQPRPVRRAASQRTISSARGSPGVMAAIAESATPVFSTASPNHASGSSGGSESPAPSEAARFRAIASSACASAAMPSREQASAAYASPALPSRSRCS